MVTSLSGPPGRTALTDKTTGQITPIWLQWLQGLIDTMNFSGLPSNRAANLPGVTAVIVTAKLTLAGANGSMTFTNGILTAQTPAT